MKIKALKNIVSILLPTIVFLLSVTTASAQLGNNNYIRVRQPRTKITSAATLDSYTNNKDSVSVSYQYIDGLGRPLQNVQQAASPSGKDIVQPFAYDAYGRDPVRYLPYTASPVTPGSYDPTALTGTGGYTGSAQYQFYQQTGQGYVTTPNPSLGTVFEASPMNRVTEQGAPGAIWQLGGGHTARMDYTFNDQTAFAATPSTSNPGSHKVAFYTATVNTDQSRTLVRTGNTAVYGTGQLSLTISKDENWNAANDGCLSTTEEYKDKEGHVLLKRTYNLKGTNVEMLSTYYVYDDNDMLAFVLPPGVGPDATTAIPQVKLDNLCYQYRYDERGRLAQKKLPGKGWEYVVYNIIDQPVATQDSMQRAASQWIFTKYDGMGRTIMTGIWTNGGTAISRANLQTTLNGISINLWEKPISTGTGYNNAAWPTNNTTPLTINFYDTYSSIPLKPAYATPSNSTKQTRGLLTVTETAVLNTPTDLLWKVVYYDDLARNIKTYAEHYLGGTANTNNYDAVTSTYNFTNAVTTAKRQHFTMLNTTTPAITVANTYIYDHTGRKLKTWEQITNGALTADTKTLISKLAYNEIGQIKTKYLHSTDSVNFLQNVAYTYNERGWMLSNSALLFEEQLQYNIINNVTGITPTAQYNGNIASQSWGTSSSPDTKSFTYLYDRINRLTSGNSTDNYKENSIIYDQMGNLTALKRYQANTLIDNLTYTYAQGANATYQLQKLRDTTTSDIGLKHGTWLYTYDGNGNLITDPSKGTSGITYTYNLLNLPQSIAALGTTYTYDAAGSKLRRIINTTNTDYISGIQYDGGIISFIQTDEGRALPNGTTAYNYEYNLTDHLGDTRLTFDTGSGIARQEQQDDYYPFGMDITRGTIGSPKNEYLYNKKEFQENLGVYDYGARFYDPVVARWTVYDPLVEAGQESTTPYGYVFNDPVKLTDPDGRYPNGPGPAGGILIGGLAIAGGMVAVAAPTGIGEVIAVPAAIVTATGAVLIAGGVGLWGIISHHFSSNIEPASLGTSENPQQTSRAARRDAMRQGGVPTSQPLHQDKKSRTSDQVLLDRDGDHTVQDARNDESHQGQPHWEAGKTKKDQAKPEGFGRSGTGRSNTNKPQMATPKGKSYYKPNTPPPAPAPPKAKQTN